MFFENLKIVRNKGYITENNRLVDNPKNVVVTKFWVDLTKKSPCDNNRLIMNIFIRLLRCSTARGLVPSCP